MVGDDGPRAWMQPFRGMLILGQLSIDLGNTTGLERTQNSKHRPRSMSTEHFDSEYQEH